MSKRVIDSLVIDSAAVTADEESAAINILHMDNWSVQIIWTSTTASATVQIEESNDGSTWSVISGKTQAINNNSGNVMLSGSNQASKYIRVNVDSVTGSITTIQAYVVAKSL